MNSPEYTPAQTQTPEHTPSRTPQELLSVDNIEAYRQSQTSALWDKTSFLKSADVRRAERDEFMLQDLPQMHRNYLAQAGVDEQDPRYGRYMALLNNSAIETSNPMGDPWNYAPNDNPSKRDLYVQEYNQLFTPEPVGEVAVAPRSDMQPAVTVIDRDPALVGAEEKLATLREAMATASAKRQGKLFGQGSKYKEIKEQYDAQLIKVAKLKMGSIDRTQLTDSELNGLAIGHYLEEQNALRAASKEKLANTAPGKFINWITSGGKAARLGKGMLVGAGGVIAGAGIGALMGIAAGTALVAGAAATMRVAVSSARGFATKDNQQGRGMAQLDDGTHKLEAQQYLTRHAGSAESREDLTHSYFQEVYEKDTQGEQEKRRRSARRGIAGAAIGAVLGGTAAYAIGEAIDARPDGRAKFGDWSNRNLDPTPDVPRVTPDSDAIDNNDAPGPAPSDADRAIEDAQKNTIPSSDTPAVADAIRDALGGGADGSPVPAAGPFSGELGATTLTPSGLEALTQSLDGYTVKSGDSVWNLAEQHLHAQGITNPSVYQIDAAKDAILPVLQAHGAADANGWLTTGQRISLR